MAWYTSWDVCEGAGNVVLVWVFAVEGAATLEGTFAVLSFVELADTGESLAGGETKDDTD